MGVISPLIWVTTEAILLLTLLITTHEPPCRVFCFGFKVQAVFIGAFLVTLELT